MVIIPCRPALASAAWILDASVSTRRAFHARERGATGGDEPRGERSRRRGVPSFRDVRPRGRRRRRERDGRASVRRRYPRVPLRRRAFGGDHPRAKRRSLRGVRARRSKLRLRPTKFFLDGGRVIRRATFRGGESRKKTRRFRRGRRARRLRLRRRLRRARHAIRRGRSRRRAGSFVVFRGVVGSTLARGANASLRASFRLGRARRRRDATGRRVKPRKPRIPRAAT